MLILSVRVLLFSGTTGKIAGRITDTQSGQPLIGVNILIEGTSLGAASDWNGYYNINYVGPGQYTLRATMIGYKTVIQKNVNVMIDLTSTINFEMEIETLKGEEVIVVATSPVVQKDVTSTSFRVGSDQIDQLQVQDLSEIIDLQAGVVEGHFRGGRSGEVMYIVDGIPMNDVYSGEVPFDVENDIIQEVEIISGTFNAEYGQAMSGVVNIVTKEGQEFYSGKVSMFAGDYISNHKDVFMHIDDIDPFSITNTQFSLSGPIPLLGNKITFSILGRSYNSTGWMYGKRNFLPGDFIDFTDPEILNSAQNITGSGDGKYIPMNPTKRKTFQGKLTFKVFKNDKINISSFYQDKNYKDYDRKFKYNPEGDYSKESNSIQNSIQYTHLFNAGTFITANFSNSVSEFGQFAKRDTSDYSPIWYLISTGATGFSTGGMRMWRHFRKNTTQIAKVDLSSQMTRIQKIGAGISYKRCKLWLHEYWLYHDENSNVHIPVEESWYNNSYAHHPIEISAYMQDKLELGDMIINAGLRYDYFNPDGKVPEQFYNTRDAEKRDAKSSYQVSPRFGIAYPISDKGVIHFSYGHFFQVPNYEHLYVNPDFEVSLIQLVGDQPPRGRFNLMGNSELIPQKTVNYEIGVKQALTEDLTVNVTAYNKDIRDLIGQETRTDIFGGKYWRFINRDYANAKGITFALEQREIKGGIGFSVDYTYQVATGNASDPNDEWENQKQDPPIQSEKTRRPLNWDQTHSLNMTATTTQMGYHLSLIGKIGSGTPYTRASARYSNRILNGERKPAMLTFDMNLTKDFYVGTTIISPFIKIYNLFDRKNNKEVYKSSGSAEYDYDLNFQTYIGIKTQDEWAIQPDYYHEPRKVVIGFSVSFSQR